MNIKKYYIVHYDFWIPLEKTDDVLSTLSSRLTRALKRKRVEHELFIFGLINNKLAVPTVLVVLTESPGDETIDIIIKQVNNALVTKSNVFEEGEILLIESNDKLLPFQFMAGESVHKGYMH